MELLEKCMEKRVCFSTEQAPTQMHNTKTVNPVNYIYRTTIQKPVNQSVKANLTTCGQ